MESSQYRMLDVLRPEIVAFHPSSYDLAADLKSLVRVREAGATEAVVFYCARVLESLASVALQTIGMPASGIVISNLETLQQFNLMSAATRYWAHALRRMGNDVRHVLRQISETDADLAMIFAERWMTWFFCEFAGGPKMERLIEDGEQIFIVPNPGLVEVVRRCERGEVDGQDEALFLSPAVAALAAEILIERGEHESAARVLREAVNRFGGDVRLRQLDGLFLSRTGKLESALSVLEPLYRKFGEDPETAGILAGVYKRMGDGGASKAYEIYRDGWERMHRSSAYLGINAATMALILGKVNEAHATARDVKGLIEGRVKVVERYLPDASRRMDFWDRVILAEAGLLLGDVATARETYAATFKDYSGRVDDIGVARTQGRRILELTGRLAADGFLQ
jgi:hypothetical protein